MKKLSLLFLLLCVACNPELKELGGSKNDLVKYFQLGGGDLGEGYLIVAHVGEKRVLTFYIKNANGYSHTDVTLASGEGAYILDSVYSQTPDCKLNPDFKQGNYLESLNVGGESKLLKLQELNREEAMKTQKKLSC